LALKSLGAEILRIDPSSEPGEVGARLDDHGKLVWIPVTTALNGVNVDAIEPFRPSQANELNAALD
jgi:hypothetical protein